MHSLVQRSTDVPAVRCAAGQTAGDTGAGRSESVLVLLDGRGGQDDAKLAARAEFARHLDTAVVLFNDTFRQG